MGDSENMFGDDTPEAESEDNKPSAAELEAAGQNSMFGGPEPEAGPELGPEAEPASQAGPDDAAADPAAEAPIPEDASAPAQDVAAPASKADAAQPYRVLARKYRPQTFAELIGQEPMVRTLANAIKRDRIAHAFLMTGVRGVGKTSTARLISKALNCIGPDGQGGPTIDPCDQCEPCRAIAEGRHIDVIEMDAASHTGVDDVREIIEAVRYAAVSARYKIYIIDEVHMLSRNAFNALLKTLEEPPAHVKFLFATTEVDKLPVTVLSRTQRFDLRRISSQMLQDHFANICVKENVQAEEEALAMISAAAEGSVRDGLSILDQAIAHADMDMASDGSGEQAMVTAERVRDMLGLADRGAKRRLFGALLENEPAALLEAIDHQYSLGVEPLALMRGMMDLAHRIAISQIGNVAGLAASAEEVEDIEAWAKRLNGGQVHRLWQLLLKGYDEVRNAPDPLVAAQMALLRVLHASDLPDPGKLAKMLQDMAANGVALAASGEGGGAGVGGNTAPQAGIKWADLVNTIENAGALGLASRLRMQVRVIELTQQNLTYTLAKGFSDDLSPELRDALLKLTGERWNVEKTGGEGAPSIVEAEEAEKADTLQKMRNHPLVKAAITTFPNARFIEEESGHANWNKRA